jgi:putative nucleotidyltransferase with HDIG domain
VTTTHSQLELGAPSHRLHERLASVGLGVASVRADGVVTYLTAPGPLEQMLCRSPAFTHAVAQQFEELASAIGTPCAIWPGVWLTRLSPPLWHRPDQVSAAELAACMLCGPELLVSDQFRLACDTAGVDHKALVAQIDPNALLMPHQVHQLAATIGWLSEDDGQLERRNEELAQMTAELGESYEELNLLYRFSSSGTVDQSPDTFLEHACEELCQVAGLTWMALRLINDDPRLSHLAGRLITCGPTQTDDRTLKQLIDLVWRKHHDVEATVFVNSAEVGVPGIETVANELLVVKLAIDDKPLGLLVGGDKIDGSHITTVDTKLCSSLAHTLAMFLSNMMLYEDVQAMFVGSLQALTSAIDAKDSYTHGHSGRVAALSRSLATSAGLDDALVERIYIAGLVHDIGKIGVPESVLQKPGRLTAEEFDQIKQHPEIGARILRDIRQMQDIIPAVLFHHERWDGKGYPYGLGADDIPLFGRVICLADSFDAMCSTRTYRAAMDQDQVRKEIRSCAGSHFDPDLVEPFLRMDFGPYHQLNERRFKIDHVQERGRSNVNSTS